jgi:hypothetical protein
LYGYTQPPSAIGTLIYLDAWHILLTAVGIEMTIDRLFGFT